MFSTVADLTPVESLVRGSADHAALVRRIEEVAYRNLQLGVPLQRFVDDLDGAELDTGTVLAYRCAASDPTWQRVASVCRTVLSRVRRAADDAEFGRVWSAA